MISGGPVRRSRGLIFGFVVFVLVCLYYAPWELPSSVKDLGISRLSRANIAQLSKAKPVDEIYGLLYLVTSTNDDHGRILTEAVDVTQPVPWDIYSAGTKVDWAKQKDRIDLVHPIVVFSKTYCPYSRKAKQLLESYHIQPPPKIIEVDTREDGHLLKSLLHRLTQHSTFPNILIQGSSIGGSDNLQGLHANGQLELIIESTGAKVRKSPTI